MTARLIIGFFYLAVSGQVLANPSLSNYDVLEDLNISSLDDQKKLTYGAATHALRFEALDRQFDLVLWDNAKMVRKISLPDNLRLLKGSIKNAPESWVRLTIKNQTIQGMIWDGNELYTIQHLSENQNLIAPGMKGHIIYGLRDLQIEPGTMSCGTNQLSTNQNYIKLVSELRNNLAKAPGATQEIDLSVVGDFPLTQQFGANSESELLTRFNIVDGIFSEQVGVQITVDSVTLENQADGTFTTTNAGDLLDELSDFRGSNPSLTSTGLTHMYTGRDLDGSTVGVAFLGALCSNAFGAGLSMGGISLTTDTLIAAHEIGHNFGASHDGESGSPCESVVGAFLMSANVNGNDNFSQCSLDSIQPEIAGASCITPLAAVDVAVIAQNGVSANFGEPFNFIFNVNNNGSGTANNVSFDVTIPNGLVALSVTPSSGTCTQAAGGYACSLGTIGSGSTASVAFNFRGDSAGFLSVPATVSADDDTAGANNTFTASIEIEAVVDLGVSFASTSDTISVNTNGTANLTLQNTGQTQASDITLTLEAPNAYDITNVSLTGSSCNVAAKIATCDIAALAAGASLQATITVVGQNPDNGLLRATVSTVDTDPNTQNDVTTKNFNIQAQSSANGAGSGGGGGSSGLLFFCLLVLRLVRPTTLAKTSDRSLSRLPVQRQRQYLAQLIYAPASDHRAN